MHKRGGLMSRCAALLATACATGCFSEQSFRIDPSDTVRLSTVEDGHVASTRDWLTAAHERLAPLLPASKPSPLLSESLVDADGQPVDVYAHFGMRRATLRSVLGNLRGIRCTAQAAGSEYHIDEPARAWRGFDDVWIPIDEKLSLSGRLGFAREPDGAVRNADCIVLMPGLFGDNGVKRTRDLAVALRWAGFHVLALELRGHGLTEGRYPDQYFTFGVLEVDDLMAVADWLEAHSHVRRTGLIGFCWSANIAVLAAWYENRPPDDPGISAGIAEHLRPPDGKRRFTAGVIAFSPVVRWENLVEDLKTPRSFLRDPIYASIQDIVERRMIRKGYPETSGNLRNLIRYEYQGYHITLPGGDAEGFPFLRLLEHRGQPAGDKLAAARVPVLMVHGANDPLAPAQDVAELMAVTKNPMVAALILPGGGHVGFAVYAREYYFNLIVNFFDIETGPAAPRQTDVAAISSADP